jgi:hypothetical protein
MERVTAALERLWTRRIQKAQAMGVHGILFYGLAEKRQYYPTLKDEEAVNPDGTRRCCAPTSTRRGLRGKRRDCEGCLRLSLVDGAVQWAPYRRYFQVAPGFA